MPASNAEIQVAVLKKEVELLEQQRDQFKHLYEEEHSEKQGGQKLLADQREKQDAWERSFEELKQHITEQNRTAQQELAAFKRETDEKLMRYRRALNIERNRSI
jgi:hypothetical protein